MRSHEGYQQALAEADRGADEVDDMARLLIERACHKLIVEYCHLIDLDDASAVADLFAPDGVWETTGRRWAGRDEIRSGFQKRQEMLRRSRHVATTIDIEVLTAKRAFGITYFVLFRYDGKVAREAAPMTGQQIVGEYYDEFVVTDDGWRFASRRARNAFLRPAVAPRRSKPPHW